MSVCWLGKKKKEDFRLAFIRTGNPETSAHLGCPWPGMWIWFCRSHGEAGGSLWPESHSAPHTDNTPDTPICVLQSKESFPYISVHPICPVLGASNLIYNLWCLLSLLKWAGMQICNIFLSAHTFFPCRNKTFLSRGFILSLFKATSLFASKKSAEPSPAKIHLYLNSPMVG